MFGVLNKDWGILKSTHLKNCWKTLILNNGAREFAYFPLHCLTNKHFFSLQKHLKNAPSVAHWQNWIFIQDLEIRIPTIWASAFPYTPPIAVPSNPLPKQNPLRSDERHATGLSILSAARMRYWRGKKNLPALRSSNCSRDIKRGGASFQYGCGHGKQGCNIVAASRWFSEHAWIVGISWSPLWWVKETYSPH